MMCSISTCTISMLACVVALMLCPPAAVGAESGSLAGAFYTYISVVMETDPPPEEVSGRSLCTCRYQCYADPDCKGFSFTKGKTEAENVCFVPVPDAKVKGYKRKDGYFSFLKEPMTELVFTVGAVTYHFIKNTTPFYDAPFFCPLGTRLACPSDTEQYGRLLEFIQGNKSTQSFDYWMDVSYTGSGWVWGDGTALSSTQGVYPWQFPYPTVKDPKHHGVMAIAMGHKLMTYPEDTEPYLLCQEKA